MDGRRFLIGWGALALFFALGVAVVGRVPAETARTVLLRPVSGDGLDGPGDYYVMVQYDLGTIDLSRVASDGAGYFPGDSVYVVLAREAQGARAVAVERQPPATGLALRGVVTGQARGRLSVLYGVESFAVPENDRASFDAFPRPFDVRVRIDDGGAARVVGLAAAGKTLPLSL